MKFLKCKLASGFDFIRRERLYFFAILLALSILAVSRPGDTVSNLSPSTALDELQKSSQELEASLRDLSGWIQIFENDPAAVMTWGLVLILFFCFFSCGIVFLILYWVIPDFAQEFNRKAVPSQFVDWNEAVFFRVLTLVFLLTVVLGFVMGNLWIETPENQNLTGLLSTLAIDFLACFSIYAVLKTGGMKWSGGAGGSFRFSWREVLHGLAAYTAVFPIFLATLLTAVGISEWLHYEPPTHPLVKIFVEEEGRSAFVFQFALILAAVAAPIFEEIFFRGFCYRLFKSWWGVPGAMGISAALFAGLHGSGFAFFPIFILGLALAWLYEKRGNLTACWTFHILHNILFTGYFFAVKALLQGLKI